MTTQEKYRNKHKLLKYCEAQVKKISVLIPLEDRPRDAKGNLDIAALNAHEVVVKIKADIAAKSIELFGENIVNRAWYRDNGFVVAAMVLTD